MSKETWLRIIIPIQGILILSQLTTGLNEDRIPHETYELVHVNGGILLFILVVFHVALNWDWIKKNYFKRR